MSDGDVTASAPRLRLSVRTRALVAGSLGFIALLIALVFAGVLGENGAYAGAVAYGLFASVFAIVMARRFAHGPQRTQWTLIGVSVLMFLGGDIATVAVGNSSAVGLAVAQCLYLTQFATVAAGMMMAALAYRQMLDVKRQAITAFAAAAALAVAATYAGYLTGFGNGALTGVYRVLAVLFPIADLVLILGPALFVLLVSNEMGAARFSWPWIGVALGAAAFAATDVAYYYLQGWQGTLDAGFIIVGTGRLVSALFFAFGASLARDVFAV